MATPKGGYYNAAGKRVPSVTTILSRFKDSSGLMKWAYRVGREHEHARATGGVDPGDLYAETEKAATAGSIAHDLIEQDILTGVEQTELPDAYLIDRPSPEVEALAWNSYRQYREWQADTKIRVIETETGGVSERLQYGGTFDGLATDSQGRLVLMDWKTSNAVYEDYILQLAAYAMLVEELRPGTKIERFHLLRVRKETADFSHHKWDDLDDAKHGFTLMRELYDVMGKLKKRV